jgi:hypothetical protein
MKEALDSLIGRHEERIVELARHIQEEVEALRTLRILRNQPELPFPEILAGVQEERVAPVRE